MSTIRGYSERRATSGGTRAARRPGIAAASSATATRIELAATATKASAAPRPKNKPERARESAESSQRSNANAETGEDGGLAQHQHQGVARRGAEGHADADVAPALSDGVGERRHERLAGDLDESEQQAAADGDERAEDENAAVDADPGETRQLPRRGGGEPPRTEPGERNPEQPPAECERHALGEQLAGDPPPRGAERDSHGEFPLAVRAARQEQARHVDAGDEEHAADGAEQHVEGGAVPADQPPLQAHDIVAPALVDLGVGSRLARADALDLGTGAAERRGGSEAGDGDERQPVAIAAQLAEVEPWGVDRGRQPDVLGRRLQAGREREIRRHHAHHRGRGAAEAEGAPDGGGVGAEAPLPEGVRDDGGEAAARHLVLRPQRPSENCGDAEQRHQVAGRVSAPDLLGTLAAAEVEAVADVAADGGEGLRLPPHVLDVGVGEPEVVQPCWGWLRETTTRRSASG